jgi:hypothetical protein
MNYVSGEPVRLGDDVDLGQGQLGQVVGVIQERRYRTDYNGADWDYLEKGILITTIFGDLRVDEPDEDLELVSRHPLGV